MSDTEHIFEMHANKLNDDALRYVESVSAAVGPLAIGEKVDLTPPNEQVLSKDFNPLFLALEYALHQKAADAYCQTYSDAYVPPLDSDLGIGGGYIAKLIGKFAGQVSNVTLTRLPNEEADVKEFFRDAKLYMPTPRSTPRELFTNYLIGVDKKSSGRPVKTAVGRLAYYATGCHVRYGHAIRATLRVVDDRTALDLQNSIDTARMLESVNVINTLRGGDVASE